MDEMFTFEKVFSQRLTELKGEKSISKFSEEIGIPERTVNGWFRGETTPRIDALIRLAKKRECSIDYLVGLEDEFGNKIY